MVIDGQVRTVVVPHDARWVVTGNAAAGERSRSAGHEPAHRPRCDLFVDPTAGMVRVQPERRAVKVVHPVGTTLVLVAKAGL